MQLDWDQIRVFLAVARAGQFAAAGRQLHMDHATVGRKITTLEDTVKGKLFDRKTTGVSLTSMGERLLSTAERMESDVLQTISDFTNMDQALTSSVRIGAPDGLGTFYLAERLAGFALRFPKLKLELVPLPRTFSLARREADLAITIEKPTEGRLTVVKLTDYTLGAYVSKRHLDRFGPINAFENVKDRVLISYVSDLLYSPALLYAEEFDKLCSQRFDCASVTSQIEAVRAGVGIGILHDYAASRFEELVRVIPSFAKHRSYWLVAHADSRSSRPISVLHEFIQSEFDASGPDFFVR